MYLSIYLSNDRRLRGYDLVVAHRYVDSRVTRPNTDLIAKNPEQTQTDGRTEGHWTVARCFPLLMRPA